MIVNNGVALIICIICISISNKVTSYLTYIAATGKNPELDYIRIDNQGTIRDTYLKFDGFTVTPGLSDKYPLEARMSRYVQFLNINVIGRGARYTTQACRIWEVCSDITIDSCTFSGGEKTGRFDGFGHGIRAPNADNLTVTNNEITQFQFIGISVSNRNVVVSNNHIHKFGGDGVFFGAGSDSMLISNNEIHDLEIYYPALEEVPTETTWSIDGTEMFNDDANWGSHAEPYDWVTNIEIVVLSGNNVIEGDKEVRVAEVVSTTHIIWDKSISSGGQPSNVDYILRDQVHGDLMQHGRASVDSCDVTISGNKLYDIGNGWAFMHLQVENSTAQAPKKIGGYNWLVENNLCWSNYANANEENGHPLNLLHIDGVVFRNNTLSGRLQIRYDANVTFVNNIISYVTVYPDSDFNDNNYNIFNRGYVNPSYPAGANTTFFNEDGDAGTWDDPNFRAIFFDFNANDFTHASADACGVGHGDPTNFPLTDILGFSRSAPPDAGAYEFPGGPLKATTPDPADTDTDISITNDLSWVDGGGAENYNVFFGTSSPGASQGNQDGTTFDTETMEYETLYYWRIDANDANGIATGDIWSFTTEDAPSTATPHFIGATQ